jgi:hypothetical protein
MAPRNALECDVSDAVRRTKKWGMVHIGFHRFARRDMVRTWMFATLLHRARSHGVRCTLNRIVSYLLVWCCAWHRCALCAARQPRSPSTSGSSTSRSASRSSDSSASRSRSKSRSNGRVVDGGKGRGAGKSKSRSKSKSKSRSRSPPPKRGDAKGAAPDRTVRCVRT